ncbi:sigma-70 family RNA polymerase sigma factor [Christensenellaceae bacterium OttesenSCG-928-M15]|nr:sigma-70 family RNA polymerase sigma factor [Christensenellaceae bacterium OttesenSCG-928-M15]
MPLSQENVFNIYRKKQHSLLVCAALLLGDDVQAEDAVQDIAVKLVQLQPCFETEGHCVSYLYTAVRHNSLNRKRDAAKNSDVYDDEYMGHQQGKDANADFEILDWIKGELQKENKAVREAFMRHVMNGEKIADIAKELGIKPNTLQARIRIIKGRMKKKYLLMINSLLMLKITILFWLR